MSKGVMWSRLMKQQQESTHSKSDDIDYHLLHQYKHVDTQAQPKPDLASTLHEFTLKVIVPDKEQSRASGSVLQLGRRWKTQSGTKQMHSSAHHSTTRSTTCYTLFRRCITFSSIHLQSDLDENDNEYIDITPDSYRRNASQICSPRFGHCRSTSPDRSDTPSRTQCTGKAKDTTRARAQVARRALSCPKLSSPLSACTPSPSIYADEQEGEEIECLQPKQEQEGRTKLKRSSSSSPLRGYVTLRKQASTPKGYIALYVGEERRRFVVKASWLNHPLFSILLEKAKEEFGFDQKGPLNIPCDVAFFQHIMSLVQSK